MEETTFRIARNIYDDMKKYEMLEKLLEEGGNVIVVSSDLTQQFEIRENRELLIDILNVIKHHKESAKKAFKQI